MGTVDDSRLTGDFGHYSVEQPLGSGGVATVYRAVDRRTGEAVALKMLHSNWQMNEEVVNRFHLEAKIAQRLKHPCIVPILDFGVVEDRPYIAMTYMARGTLAQRFKQTTRVKPRTAVHLLRRVGSAVDYAHQQGIIHRDIKLENILLDDHGNACLSDFGLARVSGATRLTISGSIMGTPLYMPPEQIRGWDEINHRTDLYSLAVVAYLLAVGQFPFMAENILTVLHQHLNEQPPLPSVLNPDLPPDMDEVLLKALAKDPADRYPNADALIEDYAQALSPVQNETLVNTTKPRMVAKDLSSKSQSADELYMEALSAPSKDQAISILKKALKIDPLHTAANRLLYKLEGARPVENKPKTEPLRAPAGFERKLRQTQVQENRRKQRQRVLLALFIVGMIAVVALILFLRMR